MTNKILSILITLLLFLCIHGTNANAGEPCFHIFMNAKKAQPLLGGTASIQIDILERKPELANRKIPYGPAKYPLDIGQQIRTFNGYMKSNEQKGLNAGIYQMKGLVEGVNNELHVIGTELTFKTQKDVAAAIEDVKALEELHTALLAVNDQLMGTLATRFATINEQQAKHQAMAAGDFHKLQGLNTRFQGYCRSLKNETSTQIRRHIGILQEALAEVNRYASGKKTINISINGTPTPLSELLKTLIRVDLYFQNLNTFEAIVDELTTRVEGLKTSLSKAGSIEQVTDIYSNLLVYKYLREAVSTLYYGLERKAQGQQTYTAQQLRIMDKLPDVEKKINSLIPDATKAIDEKSS